MYRSKVIATPEEIQELRDTMNTPLLAIHCGPRKTPLQESHDMALKHGLSEQKGHYGIDLDTGEFLSEFPIEEPGWTIETALAQLASCKFGCEAGPLEMNSAFIWLRKEITG